MSEVQSVYRLGTLNIGELNYVLARISDRLDEIQGLRGEATLYGDLNMQNNAITNSTVTGSGSFLDAYPVGSLFFTTDSADPGVTFGGTWTRFGAGRMIVGYNSGDADFDAIEETGGGKTKDIGRTGYIGNWADGAYLHTPLSLITEDAPGDNGVLTGSTVERLLGESAQDVMNPYIVVFIWKRTA